MPDVGLVANAVVTAPKDYTVPNAQEILVKSVRAAVDGTGAGGAFQVALQLLAPDGTVMWTAVDGTNTTAAGASADFTFFPGVKKAATSSGGSGIQFDTHPQSGDWLEVTTTGSDPNNDGFGQAFVDTGGGGIQLQTTGRSTDGGGVFVNYTDTFFVGGVDTGIDIQAQGDAGATIRGLNANSVAGGSSAALGINAQAVGTAAHPVEGIDATAAITTGAGAAHALALSGQANINSGGAATGDAIGLFVQSDNNNTGKSIGADLVAEQTLTGTGDVIGLRVTTHTAGGSASTMYGMQVFIGATKVFQINSDGSLHGLTGKALTFDL